MPLPLEYHERKYQVSRTTLSRYRKAGLPAIGVGGKCYIKESDFCAFLRKMNGQTVSSAPLNSAPAKSAQIHQNPSESIRIKKRLLTAGESEPKRTS